MKVQRKKLAVQLSLKNDSIIILPSVINHSPTAQHNNPENWN
jgi:hypothetical protein